jgi:hypothetical protein
LARACVPVSLHGFHSVSLQARPRGGVLGGGVCVSADDGLLRGADTAVRPVRGARRLWLADDHVRVRGVRGGSGGVAVHRGSPVGLPRPQASVDTGAADCCGERGDLPAVARAAGADRGAIRERPGCGSGDCYGHRVACGATRDRSPERLRQAHGDRGRVCEPRRHRPGAAGGGRPRAVGAGAAERLLSGVRRPDAGGGAGPAADTGDAGGARP